MNFWKQFKLSTIGKARVVEIFLASKLVYAIKFQVIPKEMEKKIKTRYICVYQSSKQGNNNSSKRNVEIKN